jgi:hypothetical protein
VARTEVRGDDDPRARFAIRVFVAGDNVPPPVSDEAREALAALTGSDVTA